MKMSYSVLLIGFAFCIAAHSQDSFDIKSLPQDGSYSLIRFKEGPPRDGSAFEYLEPSFLFFEYIRENFEHYKLFEEERDDAYGGDPIQSYWLYKIAPGKLVVGYSQSGVSALKVELNYANFIVKNGDNVTNIPVLDLQKEELSLMVPGKELVEVKSLTVDGILGPVLVRKSQPDGPFEIRIEAGGFRRIRPVPRPDNEETAKLRATVGLGDSMEVATRRLADYEQVKMAHPPVDAGWTQFWKVGDGLLAIKTNQDGTVVDKIGYILGQDSENIVTLELSRIHLTDGEMVMRMPDPPTKRNGG